jgi:predicted acetyltransferase
LSFDVRQTSSYDELVDAVLAVGQYFLLEPGSERVERFSKNLPLERMYAAREDGRVVGGAGSFPFELTVPGSAIPVAGVTAVGTYPTDRRRGVLRSLMRAQLDDVHERGEPLAALWASEETIYGRFGYGVASWVGPVTIPRGAPFTVPVERERRLRIVEKEEALALFPSVWEKVRPHIPGMLSRTRNWWELRVLFDSLDTRSGGGPKRLVVLERDGQAEGYAIYRHRPQWEDGVSTGKIEVVEAIAPDGPATVELWRFLLDIDWMAAVTASLLPIDHALFHLLANPRRMRYQVYDGLWVRLVDVGAALSARAYAGDGRIVFEVADGFCPWNDGRWKLDHGEASRTDEEPDLRCDVAILGSTYLGAMTFSALARAGRVEELRPGAVAAADAVFSWPRAPWCPEIF